MALGMTFAYLPFFSPLSIFYGFENQAVGPLNFSVGLRVVYGIEGDHHLKLMAEILKHSTI
jgi:hypothetical protein